ALIAYNMDKASALVEAVAKDEHELQFLYLLSEFEFISYEFLASLVDLKKYDELLDRFLTHAICEPLGANKEYVRLNDAIRDYVRRLRKPLPEDFHKTLQSHVAEYINGQNKDDLDASQYFFNLKTALVEGRDIDTKQLLPSHFLRAMRELYDRK